MSIDRVTFPRALPEGIPVPRPSVDGLDAPFWESAARHELVAQKCRTCSRFQWGPEHICHRCLSFDLGWEPAPTSGVVYSWERVWHPTMPALADSCPYVVVLVELDEADGIRMIGNLVGAEDVAIGQRVQAVFEDHDHPDGPYTLIQWTPIST